MPCIKNNKKAISELIAYVLLIVIALGLAAGVYTWMRIYIPPEKEKATCPEDISLYINDYACDTANKRISLMIENRGMFNIDGITIMASNSSDKLPATMLNTTDKISAIPGTYYQKLKLEETTTANFSYTGLDKIGRIRIQPFTISGKNLLLCKNIVDIAIEGC